MFSRISVWAIPRTSLFFLSRVSPSALNLSRMLGQSVVALTCALSCTVAVAQASSPSAVEAALVQPVEISFVLNAGKRPVRCGQPLGAIGSTAVDATLRDARFYVHDVALIDDQGRQVPVKLKPSAWQNEQVALMDFEDASGACAGGTTAMNRVVTGSVPAGKYTGLAFTVGVPASQNHTSTELEDAPLDLASMGWSWQAGRKFIKLEVNPEGGAAKADGSRSPTWFVHLGSTGCTGNPVTGETVSCMRPNRLPVEFKQFDASRQVVVLDISALLGASDLTRDSGGAVGCMSNPADKECVAVFERLGLSLETGTSVTSGFSPVFSVSTEK